MTPRAYEASRTNATYQSRNAALIANTQRRSLRGAPDIGFYENIGRRNYHLVASHATARRCELNDVFAALADRFRDVRLALNQLADRLLNLDEGDRPTLI